MPTVVQWRRGTTTQNNNFTGALGEISVDTTLNTVRVHDGVTAGGYAMMTATGTATLSNKTLAAPVVTGTLSSTGLINTTGNLSAAVTNTGTLNVSGTSTVAAINSTGLINTTGNISAAVLNSGAINATGLINTTGNIVCASISAGTYVGLSSNKINAGGSNVTVETSYVNVAINGASLASFGASGMMPTANAGASLGASGVRWNNIYGVNGYFLAVNANYADLAENYTSDKNYVPGTVVVFGGTNEITISTGSHNPAVAGVISTNPAYLMNSSLSAGLPVALQGRVPCRVLGPISKGDRVVTSDVPGVAERLDITKFQPGCIIGKSLESVPDGEITTIEVVVGRV